MLYWLVIRLSVDLCRVKYCLSNSHQFTTRWQVNSFARNYAGAVVAALSCGSYRGSADRLLLTMDGVLAG